MNWTDAFQTLAIVATGLFSGAALYVNLVEHPARLESGVAVAATQWKPSYERATRMQVPLALLGFAAGLVAWFGHAGTLWLVGALLIVGVIPYTLVVIFPTNKKLLDPGLDKGSAEARGLLVRWGRLHAVRSILSLAAFLSFVAG